MDRRTFVFKASLGTFAGLAIPLADPLWAHVASPQNGTADSGLASLKIDVQSPDIPRTPLGMPGLFPGRVIETFHERAVVNRRVSADAVRDMVARGMTSLTGDTRPQDAWARFFDKTDVVLSLIHI